MYKALITSIVIFNVGCTSFLEPKKLPQLAPNQTYNDRTEIQHSADRDECLALANGYIVKPNPYAKLIDKTLLGAIVGSATGAVSGSITGDVGESVAAGAAVGSMVGFIQTLIDLKSHAPHYERFVEHCLQQKGYQIIGWH